MWRSRAEQLAYTGHSGVKTYDSIAWSARPLLRPYTVHDLPIQVVRHLGTDTRDTVQASSASRRKNWDALLLGTCAPGLTEAWVAGQLIQRSNVRGILFYLPADIDSLLEFPSSAGSLGFHFRPGYLDQFLDPDGGQRIAPIVDHCPPAIADLLIMIEQELARPGLETRLLVEGLLRAVALMLARHDGGRRDGPSDRIVMTKARLNRVFDFVEDQLDSSIGLVDMAGLAGLSPFHFSRAFKESVGVSPYKYVRSRRLARAQMLLAAGDMPLTEIALACGFANQSHFTAAFTQCTGMSPGNYRRTARDAS